MSPSGSTLGGPAIFFLQQCMDGTDPATPWLQARTSLQPFFPPTYLWASIFDGDDGPLFPRLAGRKRQGGASLKMQDKWSRLKTSAEKPRKLWKPSFMEKTLNQAVLDLDGLPSARQAPTLETSWKARREAHQDGDHLTNLHRLAGPQARLGGYRWKDPRASARSLSGAQGPWGESPNVRASA